jgi:hypothetical protein
MNNVCTIFRGTCWPDGRHVVYPDGCGHYERRVVAQEDVGICQVEVVNVGVSIEGAGNAAEGEVSIRNFITTKCPCIEIT